MKKIVFSVVAIAIAMSSFTSCNYEKKLARKERNEKRKEYQKSFYAVAPTKKDPKYWEPFWNCIVPGSYDGWTRGHKMYFDPSGAPLAPQAFQIRNGYNQAAVWKLWSDLKTGSYHKTSKR